MNQLFTRMKMVKAYVVYPGTDTMEMGCALIYAYSRNQAKMIGMDDCPWDIEYLEISARRVKHMDEYALSNQPTLYQAMMSYQKGWNFMTMKLTKSDYYDLTVEAFSLWLAIIGIPLPESRNERYTKLRRIENKAWYRYCRRIERYYNEAA